MKLLRYFVNITFVCLLLGTLLLLNDGELTLYAIWELMALGGAVWYMNELKGNEK